MRVGRALRVSIVRVRQNPRKQNPARRPGGDDTSAATRERYLPSSATRWVNRDTLRLAEFL
jgi:hypothetical protein